MPKHRVRDVVGKWGHRAKFARVLRHDSLWEAMGRRVEARDFSALEVPRTTIGEGSYVSGGLNVTRYEDGPEGRLRIGAYCSISTDVEFMLGVNHPMDRVTTWPGFPAPFGNGDKGDITIGNDVWIGKHAVILNGVTVGDGAIVATRAIVTKDVEPYSIVAGNPAQHKRWRFEPELAARLQATRWWTWPRAELDSIAELLYARELEPFLEYAQRRAA